MLNNKALMLLLIVSILLSIVSPYFLTTTNILNVIRQACVLAIMGIGFTLLLSSGSMDLSVGNLMAMIGVVMAILDSRLYSPSGFCGFELASLGISGLCLNTFLVQQFQLLGFYSYISNGMLYTGVMWIVFRRSIDSWN